MKEKLAKENIETLYKYKGQTNELQGISFKLGDYKYKGSEIDRKFSINNLQKILQQHQSQKLFKSSVDLWYSKSSSENKELEIKKPLKHIHHFHKQVWLSVSSFIISLLLAYGWINCSNEKKSFEANDMKYRYWKANGNSHLLKIVYYTDSLYNQDKDHFIE